MSNVTIQDVGTEVKSGTSLTSFNYTGLTVSALLSNSVASFPFFFNGAVTAIAATWNGAPCTQIPNALITNNGQTTSSIFGILNPAPGNNTLAVSWTGAAQLYVCGSSWVNVNQFSISAAFPNGNSNNTASPGTTSTITIPTATTDAVLAVHGANNGAPNILSVSNTQLYLDNTAGIGNGANYEIGGATATLTASFDSGTLWSAVGTDIAAIPGITSLDSSGQNIMRVQPPGWRWHHRDFSGWRPAPFERRRIVRPSRQILLLKRALIVPKRAA